MSFETLGGFKKPKKKGESEPQNEVQNVKHEHPAIKPIDSQKRQEEAREGVAEIFELYESKEEATAYPKAFYGAFVDEPQRDKKIVLSQSASRDVEAKAHAFRTKAKFMTSTIHGTPIATEYDNRTNNFSTQTKIITLEDGRKVFAVYAHAGSVIHRLLDHFMKWASGLKMSKVSRKEWKRAFEEKSNIPVIENADPNTVLLPFHSNVNAYDLFANNHEIENFGENAWAKNVDAEAKIAFAEAIMVELARVHGQNKAWGETILSNIIFTNDKHPIICDPEIRYDEDVPFDEAKARDLKDILISVCGALSRSEGVNDFEPIVRRLLHAYGDETIIPVLQALAGKKRSLLQNLTFGYEQVRSGATSKQQYDEVLSLIRGI